MNLQELIDFHTVGAESCEAYAITPDADAAKNKDIAKHYSKRAKWHRDAIETIGNLATQAVFNGGTLQNRVDVAEQRAAELESLLPNAELALKALNVAVSVYDVELADNARRGLRELIAALKPAEEGEGS